MKKPNRVRTANRITLLDLLAFLHPDFDHNTGHGSANGPGIRRGLLSGYRLHCRVFVFDGDRADLQTHSVNKVDSSRA